jgi:hypothetical protein
MEDFNFDLNDLSNLFQCTPSLRYLNATIKSHSECKQMRIISIKLSFRNSLNSMINLFQKFPNLYRLTIKIKNIYLNGYEWKKIIVNYLPKLKIDFKFARSRNIEEELDELFVVLFGLNNINGLFDVIEFHRV